jgi:uncharacterized membrane protein YjjP (DUF1212 family)
MEDFQWRVNVVIAFGLAAVIGGIVVGLFEGKWFGVGVGVVLAVAIGLILRIRVRDGRARMLAKALKGTDSSWPRSEH